MALLGPARPGGSSGEPREPPAELEARNLVDQLPAIVYVSDVGVEGRWHYVSSGVQALLGFSPEEWLADPGLWARQMHPDDRERVFRRETALVEPDVPEEYRICHRDGRIVWVRDEAALLTDGEGGRRWHGVISDVTDRKLAEVKLERRAEQQAAVARLGKHALEGCDVGELMEDALQAATRILDVEMGAVLERPANGSADPAGGARSRALSAARVAGRARCSGPRTGSHPLWPTSRRPGRGSPGELPGRGAARRRGRRDRGPRATLGHVVAGEHRRAPLRAV